MNRTITILPAIVLFSPCFLYADYIVKDRGTWPASWPKELEGLRKQSRTLEGPRRHCCSMQSRSRTEKRLRQPGRIS